VSTRPLPPQFPAAVVGQARWCMLRSERPSTCAACPTRSVELIASTSFLCGSREGQLPAGGV
jgi:hypothetical protein